MEYEISRWWPTTSLCSIPVATSKFILTPCHDLQLWLTKSLVHFPNGFFGFCSRVQDHCEDRDTPDSFVPSSSPESVVGMEISRYPDLSVVKEENPEPVPSPIIPILPSSTGKGEAAAEWTLTARIVFILISVGLMYCIMFYFQVQKPKGIT